MIDLGNLAKGRKLEDPAATPVIITPLQLGKHTVAYADGRVERIATEALQAQLVDAGILMPPNARAEESPPVTVNEFYDGSASTPTWLPDGASAKTGGPA